MAWRFKASKYKNAAPVVPKPEACIRDISVGSYQTYGNNIAASAAFMAFNVDHNGSSLAVLPIDDCGRKSKTMPLLHAHTDTVTDMDFSPFHDGLLATGSQDCLVKLWHIPEKGLEESLSNAECTFSHKQRRVETVCFHPTADFLLTTTSYTTLTLWDISSEKEMLSNAEHSDVIQSLSWKKDGTLLATSCKDKQVRILDPRLPANSFTHMANSHQSIKDSRVVWLGDANRILTTGFDSGRQREVFIRDLRNFEDCEKSLVLDSSTGILIPLYDPDTGMLFLAGKGDTTVSYLEVTDREPYLIEGIRHNGDQTKGACLVPKRALAVMQGEVNRLLQLTSSSVIPIMYQVPRKSYRDFHADLFPDTTGCEAQLSAAQWLQGHNVPVPRISLDPAKRSAGESPIQVHRGSLSEMRKHLQRNPYTGMSVTQQMAPKIQTTMNLKEEEHMVIDHKKEKGGERSSDENGLHHNNDLTKSHQQNGSSENHQIIPPKPFPRSSRTGSLSEMEDVVVAPPKPKPRTISTSVIPPVTSVNPAMPITGGYKPRLGPKPFTPPKLNFSSGSGEDDIKATTEFSFEKVFSVPVAPGHEAMNGVLPNRHGNSWHTIDNENNGINQSPYCVENDFQDKGEECLDDKCKKTIDNIPSSPCKDSIGLFEEENKSGVGLHSEDVSGRDAQPNSGSLEDLPLSSPTSHRKPKTPSTAERRKFYEKRISSVANEQDLQLPADALKFDDVDDKLEDFERASVQRSSIAERRRMYENRSSSVQEAGAADKRSPTLSPTPLRRQDSFKNSKTCAVDEVANKRSPVAIQRQQSQEQTAAGKSQDKKPEPVTTPTPKRTSTVFGRVSKFRHLKGTPLHKSMHIENIRNVSRQISGECDGFHANHERVAVPLSGPGGKIAVFELSKTGKLPDGVIPTLVHGTNIMDFAWDPFNCKRLAVACDDGTIRLWLIPKEGLAEPTNEPHAVLAGHSEKIYFIKFHPLAEDVLASGSYDMTIRIWDLATHTERIVLQGHTDQMFSFAWSPCGAYCATVSKDSKLRVYKPRSKSQAVREGRGPIGSRGARVVWALEGRFIVVTGFDKVSERQIQIFKADSLSVPLNTVGLDVSPAILMPFYDEDSSTLFLTGKGDSTIYAFEVTEEAPYLCPLSHHRCNSLHQGLSFLPKSVCDVSNVEFARALRLTNNTIEPLSFTVPRIKSDLFQDDLFPPTKVTWKPTLTSTQWFQGMDKQPPRQSLKPDGMECLSGAQGVAGSGEKSSSKTSGSTAVSGSLPGSQQPYNHLGWNSDITGATKEKQEQIQRAVGSRMEVNLKLEQDGMEGVDEHEWVSVVFLNLLK
ncbi:coronin-7 isoform X2 [Zootermopsis nevadensis]|uniref:coronin-7 isoform X2 n=1 Tax=Zootermopsis nevadensis TaxID=136037 RepID=UPI000B8EAC17|nr:coronin-7 isoform X2 [Zootermopsis nevadensis]